MNQGCLTRKVDWTSGTIFAIDGDYLTTDTWTTDTWTTDAWTTDAWVTGGATTFMKPGEVSS
jgi:hypothetical protein